MSTSSSVHRITQFHLLHFHFLHSIFFSLSLQVFYHLYHARAAAGIDTITLVRVEQVAPFPFDLLGPAILRFPQGDKIIKKWQNDKIIYFSVRPCFLLYFHILYCIVPYHTVLYHTFYFYYFLSNSFGKSIFRLIFICLFCNDFLHFPSSRIILLSA